MKTDDYVITLEALQELAADCGSTITRQWLAKYGRLGLLPEQHVPGLGQGKGRRGLYSIGLARQLIPLIQALDTHGKNLNAVGWQLWWQGYSIAPRYWRDRLTEIATTWKNIKARFPDSETAEAEGDELLQKMAAQLNQRKDAGRLIGAVKRHDPGQLPDMLAIMSNIVNGSFMPLNSNSQDEYDRDRLQKLFAKSFSIPVSQQDIPNDNSHFPISVPDLDEMLVKIARFSDIDMGEFLAGTSDSEIETARNEIAPFLNFTAFLEQSSQKNLGKTMGAKALAWSNASPKGQAAILLGWLLVRRDPVMQEKINALNKIISHQIKMAMEKQNAV